MQSLLLEQNNRNQMVTFSALLTLCAGNSLVTSESQSQRSAMQMFSLICAWTYGCVNIRDTGDLRRHRAHYDVTVMFSSCENAMSFIWKYLYATTNDHWTLFPVVARGHQPASYYLKQCWPRFMPHYGVTSPKWMKCIIQKGAIEKHKTLHCTSYSCMFYREVLWKPIDFIMKMIFRFRCWINLFIGPWMIWSLM